jgi:2-keto-4-pentenoate hydratase/2-oxohepta-3-ene-1,7-dioic acid hydratase in catechol pathway
MRLASYVAGGVPRAEQRAYEPPVNGVTKQDSSTRFMVLRIPRIISEISTRVTLEPGDVILTGTLEGVGFARKPPEYLNVGDVMEAEIEKIGVLRNTVVKIRPIS